MTLTFTDFMKSEYARQPHYLVVGHPISHSLSPAMHSIAIKEYAINAIYVAVDVSLNEMSAFAAWMNRKEFLGCNITIPYKEKFLQLVDELNQHASNIGAINTIVKESSKIIGYNTDVYGFLKPIHNENITLEGSDAIIFGTGGASKAIIQGLLSMGVEQTFLVSRTPSAKAITENCTQTISYNQWQAHIETASIIINTTPLGMYPNIDSSPVREGEGCLLEGKICYDVVYNPFKTKFLKLTEPYASKIISGLDMLIYQGSKSFELWTGFPFPYQKVKTELMKQLASNA